MGDFNSFLYLQDNYYGSSSISIGMKEFKECVVETELIDINSSGFHYTWTQKPKKGVGILKKIDRIMGNMQFITDFPSSYAIFQPYRVSDHTPCVLKLPSVARYRPRPFKFSSFITSKFGFLEAVEKGWKQEFKGYKMFCVVKKIRALKTPMRKLLLEQGNLHASVTSLRNELDEIQKEVDNNQGDESLREKEMTCLEKFKVASYDEECFLKQKAKIDWLNASNSNTAYFHNTVKCKNHRKRIKMIKNADGQVYEGEAVNDSLVTHYTNFLGVEQHVEPINADYLFTNVLDPHVAS
uniref:uncharacterized protein LOC122583113 n=1 Tax=Erigeron canadensis TaxID=72917 RepID=UPI001CB8A040|nr:uncharacterized protein LOC122583113 [Erigeron canadensis]